MDLIKVRRDLHRIPELGFQEYKTQQYILAFIKQLPQSCMHVTTWRTGVVVYIQGTNPAKTIGWRTDIDGLPIAEETHASYASAHEGQMHACGHDCHITIALSLVRAFAMSQPKQNVVIYFQPAEEGPGGAEPMLAWLREQRPDLLCDEIYALHIAPEYPVGTIATRPGLLFANTSELFIDLKGMGGHAAYPHLTRDMAVAAATLLVQLQTIVSRNIDPMNSVVVTVGKMTAGTAQNIIAEHARLEGTIRTVNAESMMEVKRRIEAICAGIEAAYECEVSIDYGSMYYEVKNDTHCAEKLLAFAKTYDGAIDYLCPPAMTGEDFGYFVDAIPGAMFWSGADCPYNLHHAKMNPNEQLLTFNAQFAESFIRTL